MDNDLLIDQARRLYARLAVSQVWLPYPQTGGALRRFEQATERAYGRYLRRLNRCACCHRQRGYECIRLAGHKRIPCLRRPAVAKSRAEQSWRDYRLAG
ncbi:MULTISPECIES: hypothetical protein [Methylomonas]|uniref:Uncharacterized protein n=1 Tax=Methylomonas koyamae TaxID=702114 RepID=A0A177P315_9GAMM|nr:MULTISPECIES: hypothetical protein [Methylomonas]MDT4329934.1 hypothetical protein [Methylomonas sp. MV1]OAI24274.1 hypothetical protein A1355_20880 [Methylomonas koyamae]OHX35422.1 hypothetical protein BJL95_16460 [Methylomonas sp. LWB]WGS86948.1 hypothetical protein QC632_04145 [Methylomonas sp. UP202]